MTQAFTLHDNIAIVSNGILRSGGTFTRNGDGTIFGPDGKLITRTQDQQRQQFDPATGLARGLSVWGPETNWLPHNRDLSQAAWTKTATLSKNEAGLDGVANSAWTITDDDAAAQEFLARTITVPNDSNRHITRFPIKKTIGTPASFPGMGLILQGGATNTRSQWTVNPTTGETEGRPANTADAAISVHDLGDWWDVWIFTTNNSTGNTSLQYAIFPAVNTDGSGIWDLTTTGSVIYDFGGIRLDSDFLGTPILTEGAVVTRAAEVAAVPIGHEFNATSFGYRIKGRTGYGTGTAVAFQVGDGTADNRVYVTRESGNMFFKITTGGVAQALFNLGFVADDTDFTMGIGVEENNVGVSFNGGAIAKDLSVAVPTGLTTRYIGQNHSGVYWDSSILLIQEYLSRGTDNEIVERGTS